MLVLDLRFLWATFISKEFLTCARALSPNHRNLRTRRRMYYVIKRTISLVKQGKFKVGVVPAYTRGCLPLKNIFVGIMEGGMPAGASPTIFGPI
jgi:hypothetical protein